MIPQSIALRTSSWSYKQHKCCVAQRLAANPIWRNPSHPRSRTLASVQHGSVPHIVNDPFGAPTKDRGFLPSRDPIRRLSAPDAGAWEDALHEVPKLIVAGGASGVLRHTLAALPPFPVHEVLGRGARSSGSSGAGDGSSAVDGEQAWRAYLLLSFIAHAYMWCESPGPPQSLPPVLAVPWAAVSRALGMPPVLVYATYNLYNWRRLDASKPIELGNIVCLHNFAASTDEEWFRLVHIEVEARAAAGLAAAEAARAAAARRDAGAGAEALHTVARSLQGMQATLARMGEKCDPYVYYQRVRQPMSGWRNNPALPHGLVYEGVTATGPTRTAPNGLVLEEAVQGGVRMQLYGETGAQSSVVPAFDAVLGIAHGEDWLKAYLDDMRAHMPPAHRAHLTRLAQPIPGGGPSVRELCASAARASPVSGGGLREAYNEAVTELEKFRSQHKAFAYTYIAKWAKQEKEKTGMWAAAAAAVPAAGCPLAAGSRGPGGAGAEARSGQQGASAEAGRSGEAGSSAAGAVQARAAEGEEGVRGTGGTDFMPALAGYRDTTSKHLLPDD